MSILRREKRPRKLTWQVRFWVQGYLFARVVVTEKEVHRRHDDPQVTAPGQSARSSATRFNPTVSRSRNVNSFNRPDPPPPEIRGTKCVCVWRELAATKDRCTGQVETFPVHLVLCAVDRPGETCISTIMCGKFHSATACVAQSRLLSYDRSSVFCWKACWFLSYCGYCCL